jgi:hypothetical protein
VSDQLDDLRQALETVAGFGEGAKLTTRIAQLEATFQKTSLADLPGVLEREAVNEQLVRAAMSVKKAAGQINVVIHAVGILMSLPHVLAEDERILSLSLGAGNTGRDFDLETDLQVGEFKFTSWRGGAESIRQNQLFKDLLALLSDESGRKRRLYVTGKEQPLRFLNNKRALTSVLSKDRATAERFEARYGAKYQRVNEFWADVSHLVEIVDLEELVPAVKWLEE